jgi:hypothetical protein
MKGFLFQVITSDLPLPRQEGGTAVAVRKGIAHNHVDLSPSVSVIATGVCVPIDNSEIPLAAVYRSLGRAWIDVYVTELLSFKHKSILADDLNAKHQFWNSAVSNPSGEKLLFDVNEFEISVAQCCIHYSPVGSGGILAIVVHQNIRLSGVVVSDILDSDHLPIVFLVPDHIKMKNLLDQLKNSQIGNGFKALPYLISYRIEINSEEEADKAARYFTEKLCFRM